jgi:hypothetical protein
MLIVVQCFGEHCTCNLQDESVNAGLFWKPYIGQAVGGAMQWDSSPLLLSTNQHHEILLIAYCLSYVRLPKRPSLYTFTLKMAAAVFAETLAQRRVTKEARVKSEKRRIGQNKYKQTKEQIGAIYRINI